MLQQIYHETITNLKFVIRSLNQVQCANIPKEVYISCDNPYLLPCLRGDSTLRMSVHQIQNSIASPVMTIKAHTEQFNNHHVLQYTILVLKKKVFKMINKNNRKRSIYIETVR